MQRRANDAQIDRLLKALRRPDNKPGLSPYGKQLAEKIAARDKIKPASAQRRLQRYITEAGERRSFVRAPVQYQRELRQQARRLPPPVPVPLPPEQRRIAPPPREREPEREPSRQMRFDREAEYEREHTDLYELRSIIAFHDGDTREAGRALRVDARLLDLASQGITITRRMGAGRIDEGVERLYGKLSEDEQQDIQDFADLLRDLPDWRIGLIIDNIADGKTTFSDWIDAWHDDDMDIEADESEFWALWRQAYKAAKG